MNIVYRIYTDGVLSMQMVSGYKVRTPLRCALN